MLLKVFIQILKALQYDIMENFPVAFLVSKAIRFKNKPEVESYYCHF